MSAITCLERPGHIDFIMKIDRSRTLRLNPRSIARIYEGNNSTSFEDVGPDTAPSLIWALAVETDPSVTKQQIQDHLTSEMIFDFARVVKAAVGRTN